MDSTNTGSSSQDFWGAMPTFAKVFLIAIVSGMGLSILFAIIRFIKKSTKISNIEIEGVGNGPPLIVELMDNMEKLKPTRFTSRQLKAATLNFTHKLGAGGYGEVYKGTLANGDSVAVKVLKGSSDEQIEAQFIAEVSTIGRTHHVNLVRLIGFCFENTMRALVYEHVERGSLDGFLFGNKGKLGFDKLSKIAIQTAKGVAYLHEECQDRIIHYDIKPGNILLDRNFSPKVADFGLAKLCNRNATHVTMTGCRGTPGYAAPELWMPFPVTHKCDVYSYGMLLFEIAGRRRNLKVSLPESHEWFPRWVWNKLERDEMEEIVKSCEIEEEEDREILERMILIAVWCVQYKPELRPCMSTVVKWLEGDGKIALPPDPFSHLVAGLTVMDSQQFGETTEEETIVDSQQFGGTIEKESYSETTPIMRKYEINVASS
ncbi:LEAF RUST 10 DISEASE-RESISTANCE LOCUS RECEPTOR-LIKE PROTEIN KINASE-like 2.2 [Amborella trichopoda]|nr:LEAF RUST 10 DISEASE-RESISTANCE LOCUS RECEPTOR-LIKE PROTEIN KINASE-like 2.2 [Amborella trichopoda]|eukprot:XP_020523510.1 LEAF RUST 10 DISEASE-RESISTANCE LOCUS RECEPTOR-LIKE PROTEIN KINASE-like 2.2 [Amborella trichopoda]